MPFMITGHLRADTGAVTQAEFSPPLKEGADRAPLRPEALRTAMRWLALAAFGEWLITRTLTRAAIFMPKPAALIGVYQAVSTLGIMAGTFASLLAIGVLGWLAWRAWKRASHGIALLTFILLGLSLAYLFIAVDGWGRAIFQIVYLIIVPVLCLGSWRGWQARGLILSAWLPGLALFAGGTYHLLPALYEAAGRSGPAPMGRQIFNLGELLLAASPVALWWVYARTATWKDWLLASMPALAFAAFRLASPSMAGILAIWSTGLTLYLPWPIYVVSLWLAGVTVITTSRQAGLAGPAVLLLIAGGYAPQLSSQISYGLIALWLLCRSEDCSAQHMV